jgi:hypothetical protein
MIKLVDSVLEFSFGNWGTGLLAFLGVVLLFGLTVCFCVASSPYSRRSRSRRVMVPDDFYWSVNAQVTRPIECQPKRTPELQ